MSAFKKIGLGGEPGALGLNCTQSGLWLGGAALLRRTDEGFTPRPPDEIEALLKAAYGGQLSATGLSAGLGVVATALNRGELGRAMIAALNLRLPELSWDGAVGIALAEEALTKYDPDEPRDWHGRWTTAGDGGPAANHSRIQLDERGATPGEVNADTLTDAGYMGHFHDAVVRAEAEDLRAKGETVVTEISLKMADGSAGARLDILAQDPRTGIVYGVEVKTGLAPRYNGNQPLVYSHLILGGSVIAVDRKVTKLGLIPLVPLPPILLFQLAQRDAHSKKEFRPIDPKTLGRSLQKWLDVGDGIDGA